MAFGKEDLRMWRSHPVLSTFALGAAIGLGTAFTLMFSVGDYGALMNHHLLVLWPTSFLEGGDLGGPRTTLILWLIAAIVSNAILYGFTFAAPVGLATAIRRSFGKPDGPKSIGRI
jgi:hypothetical protein